MIGAGMTTRTLPRRRLAASGASLLGLTGIATGARGVGPDAELIEHCAAWQALEHQSLATDFHSPPGSPAAAAADAERVVLEREQRLVTERICRSRPSTLAGLAALAGVIVASDADVLEWHAARGYELDRMMLALLRGLTERA